MSIAREIAYDTLVNVITQKSDPNECLETAYEKLTVKRVDKNLAKEVVFGTLRWWSKMYWILQHTSNRDLDKSSPEIRVALCAGTYQIYYLDRIPDRAAVSESAEYVRIRKQSSAVSFVNGILRQIAKKANYFPKPNKDSNPIEYLALQFAHPTWIIERWHSRFSFDRLAEMLKKSNESPPYTIRINSLKTEHEEQSAFMTKILREESNQTTKRPLKGALRLKTAPNLSDGSLFSQGYYTIQDEASQLIGHMLNLSENDLVVDACCGPGGKLTHLYELGKENAHITGIERDKIQFEKTRSNLNRLGITNISLLNLDFLDYSPSEAPTKILIDAPCSGLGVLRRHPDGKMHKSPEIIPKMVDLQKKLLIHALDMLKPGGELVFSVCSFEEEETLGHINWLKKKFNDKIEIVSLGSRLQDFYKKYVTSDGLLAVYAGNQDLMDGFGAFLIRKNC